MPAGRTWRDREALSLAPYAASADRSRGRLHPEAEHPYRSPYQRDRDRIVHTNAFRRLEYKTQVFVNHEGDHYRTRLTHTIEVSLIARTLARALCLNEDLAEAVALAHDLGHPPFGHAGEAVLDDLLRDHGGFEHNSQSLRIVDLLEVRYPGFRGLNLTWEVREGLQKRRWFAPGGEGATLEAQFCDLADPIAYDAHDVDDGLRSGLLRWDELRPLAIWRHVPIPDADAPLPAGDDVGRHQRIRGLIDCLVGDLVEQTASNLERLGVETYEDLRRAGPVAAFSPEVDADRQQLQAFLQEHLYRHPRVTAARRPAEHVIRALFTAYRSDPRLLPDATRRRFAEDPPERVVCDYVAGMTDRFALNEYARVFGEDEAALWPGRMVATR